MAEKHKEPEFLAREYHQKTPFDCLKTACNILSSELPEIDTEDWNDALAILHGAGINIRCICRPKFVDLYGGNSHLSEGDPPGEGRREQAMPQLRTCLKPKCEIFWTLPPFGTSEIRPLF